MKSSSQPAHSTARAWSHALRILAWAGETAQSGLALVIGVAVLCATLLPFNGLKTLASAAPGPILVAILATAAFGLVPVASGIAIARRPQPFPSSRFLIIAIVASLASKALLIMFVEPRWGGDYQRYYDSALRMLVDGVVVHGSYYDQRAIPVALPLVAIVGDTPMALKALNAILLTAIGLLAHDVLRLSRSLQAAQGFLVLFLLAPIPLYTILIPSHDLWGLFFCAAALWLLSRIWHLDPGNRFHHFRLAALTLALTLSIELIELQRGSGPIFLAAIIVAATLGFVRERHAADATNTKRGVFGARAMALAAIFCVALFIPLDRAAVALHYKVDPNGSSAASTHMKLAAHAGTMSDGRSDWYARFATRLEEKSQSGKEETLDFARSIAFSAWSLEHAMKFQHIASQAPRLFDLGYPDDWDTTLRSPQHLPSLARIALLSYAEAFAVSFGLAFSTCLVLIASSSIRLHPLILVPLLFVGATAVILLSIFENKAPNLFAVWLAAPMILAYWVSSVPTTSILRGSITWTRLGSSILLLGALIAAVPILFHAFWRESDGAIIDHWDVSFRPVDGSGRASVHLTGDPPPKAFDRAYYPSEGIKPWILRRAPDDAARLARFAGSYYTVMEFPKPPREGDAITMTRQVCSPGGERDDLEFFFFSSYRPNGRKNSFDVDVKVNGELKTQMKVPAPGNDLQRVVIKDVFDTPSCKQLSFELVSNVSRSSASWKRASHVEIWFPRLVDAKN